MYVHRFLGAMSIRREIRLCPGEDANFVGNFHTNTNLGRYQREPREFCRAAEWYITLEYGKTPRIQRRAETKHYPNVILIRLSGKNLFGATLTMPLTVELLYRQGPTASPFSLSDLFSMPPMSSLPRLFAFFPFGVLFTTFSKSYSHYHSNRV
jgi:hypothetical protein